MSESQPKFATLNPSERSRNTSQVLSEKRKGDLAVPLNLRSLLSSAQLQSVQQMEGFGWRLAFVRRSVNETPTVVVKNDQEQSFALLKRDGSIDTSADVDVRP